MKSKNCKYYKNTSGPSDILTDDLIDRFYFHNYRFQSCKTTDACIKKKKLYLSSEYPINHVVCHVRQIKLHTTKKKKKSMEITRRLCVNIKSINRPHRDPFWACLRLSRSTSFSGQTQFPGRQTVSHNAYTSKHAKYRSRDQSSSRRTRVVGIVAL